MKVKHQLNRNMLATSLIFMTLFIMSPLSVQSGPDLNPTPHDALNTQGVPRRVYTTAQLRAIRDQMIKDGRLKAPAGAPSHLKA